MSTVDRRAGHRFGCSRWCQPGGSRRRNRTSSPQRGASLPRIYPSRV